MSSGGNSSEMQNAKIIISYPHIITHNSLHRLLCSITIVGEKSELWVSVEDKYSQYLCSERSDAFLIGLLPVAMRRGLDIVCEAPVSEKLLFQLR